MSITRVSKADIQVHVRRVLISTSDKSGLDELVPGIIEANPDVQFYSTGRTYDVVSSLSSVAPNRILRVSDYTGQPEMSGGLVKTLDYRIYLGLLSETYNADHQSDLSRTNAVAFDMVVVNLYPFEATVSKKGVDIEDARGNIDIGGPCMLRAAAKNFLRVAAVCDPSDYTKIVSELASNVGGTTLETRFLLAKKAFRHTADYDRAVAAHLADTDPVVLESTYELE